MLRRNILRCTSRPLNPPNIASCSRLGANSHVLQLRIQTSKFSTTSNRRNESTPPITPATETSKSVPSIDPSAPIVLLDYEGPYGPPYKKLKAFSLGSLTLAILITPLMFTIDSAISSGGRAVLGVTAISTSGLSTALIALAGGSYVTRLRIEQDRPSKPSSSSALSPGSTTAQGTEGSGGRRIMLTTTTMFLRNITTTVYDPMFLETGEGFFEKIRLRKQVRVPMKDLDRLGLTVGGPSGLVDGKEETVAESVDKHGTVKGWWAVRWRKEGDAGWVGECAGVGKIRRGYNVEPELLKAFMRR